MRKTGQWLLILVLMVLMVGCSNGSEPATESSDDGNRIQIVVKNATNEDWVMEAASYGSEEYRGELDAIYAKDFVVKAGENLVDLNVSASDRAEESYFAETSSTTYDYKMQFIAGGILPTDPEEQYVYDPFVAVVDFIVKGTYGKTATVEWDGVAFNQVNQIYYEK